MLDGREKAPLAAHKDMFVNSQGEVVKGLSKDGVLSAGIPGMPAAIVHLSEKYGRLPLAQTLQPAIRYAQQGFVIGERHRKLLKFRLAILQSNAQTASIFLDDNQVPKERSVLRQTDLANTLKRIAQFGRKGFYAGEVGDRLIKQVGKASGIWTAEDLKNYQIVEREPIRGEYKGVKITSAALPSSGGIVMIEALNILSGYPLEQLNEITRKHIISEALRRAYHDRALYLGDNDFIEVPVKRLIDKNYAAGLRAGMRLDKVTPSGYLSGSIKQKMALKKARRKAHSSTAKMHRAKSNRIRESLGI
jgi:gamma-glutamyltranspeptidase/glutathione hydrolase